ncbi:hypothetical protein QJS10_CPB11g01011 [Acorus calamus]|uniref:LysM domain-containing protein n=1 Tax=Acorus calamus TaxID=4465 RepID=A0AAV9DUV3_ACOCL|nr:hypothetical protein QJS10_CPB11g01011 [Acorus calamus]
MVLYLVVVFSLLFVISDCRMTLKLGFVKPASVPECFSVYGVESGDTCFFIGQEFNLTAAEFGAINPNLECDKLFPGQWLCVVGRA